MSVKEIIELVLKDDGATLNLDLRQVKLSEGYMVGGYSSEWRLRGQSMHDMAENDIIEISTLIYLLTQKAKESKFGAYIGLWMHDGCLYLELSELVTELNTAKQLGTDRNQSAIYDNKNGVAIKL